MRLFQILVVASAMITAILWISPYVPLISEPELLNLLSANGAGALSYEVAFGIRKYLPASFLLAGLGLFFFTWWGRPLFVVTYAIGLLSTALGGFAVWPAWEAALVFLATLADGGVLVLAFTPPLSAQFERAPVPRE